MDSDIIIKAGIEKQMDALKEEACLVIENLKDENLQFKEKLEQEGSELS